MFIIVYNCKEIVTNLPPLGKSDHEIVHAYPPQSLYCKTKPAITKSIYRSGKVADTAQALTQTNWHQIIPYETLNFIHDNGQLAFDSFYEHIIQTENYHQPLKIEKTNNDKPWMTAGIKQLIATPQKQFHTE